VGGRIFTCHDPASSVPIELGAEFIHGRPPEIWDLASGAGIPIYKRSGRVVHIDHGHVLDDPRPLGVIDRIFADLKSITQESRDLTFVDALEQLPYSVEEKGWASAYAEGFNAARKEVVSVRSLIKTKTPRI
jgi:hypothetical protein